MSNMRVVIKDKRGEFREVDPMPEESNIESKSIIEFERLLSEFVNGCLDCITEGWQTVSAAELLKKKKAVLDYYAAAEERGARRDRGRGARGRAAGGGGKE